MQDLLVYAEEILPYYKVGVYDIVKKKTKKHIFTLSKMHNKYGVQRFVSCKQNTDFYLPFENYFVIMLKNNFALWLAYKGVCSLEKG